MEIYLSHMVFFRVVERLGINSMIGNGWIQYVFTAVLVVTGSAVFAVIMQKILAVVGRQFRVRKA